MKTGQLIQILHYIGLDPTQLGCKDGVTRCCGPQVRETSSFNPLQNFSSNVKLRVCLNLLDLSLFVSAIDSNIAVEVIIVIASLISVFQLPGHVPADHTRQPMGHLPQDVGYCQER